MSHKEQLMKAADLVPEEQASAALLLLYRFLLEEAEDDAFCEQMLRSALADPDQGEGVPIEELAARYGVVLE